MDVFRREVQRLSRRALLRTLAAVALIAGLRSPLAKAGRSPLARSVAGIPFYGRLGGDENYIKPDYSTFLPASWSYPGDPTATITVDWVDFTNANYPGPDEGVAGQFGGGKWKISARSAYSSADLNVGTLFNSVDSIVTAMLAERNGTLILPAVKVKDKIDQAPSSQQPATYIIIRGAVDADGFWNTQFSFTGGGGPTYMQISATVAQDLTIDLRNMRLGPFDSEITANGGETSGYGKGGAAVNIANEYGNFKVRNCWIHRPNGQGGISAFQAQVDEWTKRVSATIDCWDCQISCGSSSNNAPLSHNVYTEGLKRNMFIRCYSHSSPGHALKTQNDMCIVLNCVLSGENVYGPTTFGQQRVYNVTDLNDSYVFQTALNPKLTGAGGPWAAEIVDRQATQSCFNAKRPALQIFKRTHTVPPGATSVLFVSGGQTGVNGAGRPVGAGSSHKVGTVSGDYTAGNTVINFDLIDEPFDNKGRRTLDDTTAHAWDIIVILDSGVRHSTTGTLSSPASGTATMTLRAGLPSALSANQPALFVKNTNAIGGAKAIDLPVLNEAFCNPAHPDYPWASLNDGAGRANMSDPNMIPAVFDTCVFRCVSSTNPPAPRTWVSSHWGIVLQSFWTGDTQGQVPPLPPLKATNGEWSDPANAGYFERTLNGSWPLMGQNAKGGTGLFGSDWVYPIVSIYKDLMGYDADITSGEFTGQIWNLARSKSPTTFKKPYNPPTSPDFCADVRWIDGRGTVNKVALSTNINGVSPMPVTIQTTLNGAVSAGATQITVADATGVTNGMVFAVAMQGPWGKLHSRNLEWFFTTVRGSPLGNVVTLGSPMPYDALSGGEVTACTKAGATPSWWPDVIRWANA